MLDLLLLTGKKKNGQTLPTPASPILTYADWVSYANAQNVPALTGGSNYRNQLDPNGVYVRITFDANSGTMWGTPWGDNLTYDSSVGRSVVHCLPGQAIVNESLTNKRIMLAKVKGIGTKPGFNALNRNGYTSSAYGSFTGTQIIDFLYWDNNLGQVMRVNPLAKSTPVSFGK